MQKLPTYLVLEVELLCVQAIQSSTLVNVYPEAEHLRRRYPNIPLRDIVEEILAQCKDNMPGFKLDVFAAHGTLVGFEFTVH
jgi:hypothetical protein